MTITTIKVSSETRDRLKEHARAADKTLGDYLAGVADSADRLERFNRLGVQIARTPAHLMDSYSDETADWNAVDGGR